MAPSPTAEVENGWPARAEALAAGRDFLRTTGGTVAIACDSDVDGLAAAVIVERTLADLGATPHVLPARRGEHVHRDSMRARIEELAPSALVVVDMGSRPEPILPGLPTLVIDHHHAAAGLPPGAVVVNGFDRPPVAPASVLAWVVCRGLAPGDAGAWLAALGAVADFGSARAFEGLLGVRAGGAAWTKAVGLLNAARRAPAPDPRIALEVLRAAGRVQDITSGAVPGTRTLERQREAVRREIERCSRMPPAIAGDVALIRCTSAAQVHPILAIRWAQRLRPRIVVAANDGYLPGRVNFAARCAADVDLVAWLRGLSFTPGVDADYANGHARATGGSLTVADFERFLTAVGFGQA